MVVLLGLPPFAMFASELSIARSLADARLAWALAVALLLIVVAFAALVRNSGRMLFGARAPHGAPAIAVPAPSPRALLVGVAASRRARGHRRSAERPVPHRRRAARGTR